VLPRRLGARFALETVFLVLLALGAGLAHLRPLYIVGVMVAAWVLVALAELTAERIDRSPVSYLLPEPTVDEEEPEHVFGPRPEERTIVAPLEPDSEPEEEEEPAAVEAAPLLPEEPAEEAFAGEPEDTFEEPEPARQGRFRSLLGRREPEAEPEPPSPPRHVKLLPRRTADEPSRASQEVAELFGVEREHEEEKPKENRT
jgi:hypothetical protein